MKSLTHAASSSLLTGFLFRLPPSPRVFCSLAHPLVLQLAATALLFFRRFSYAPSFLLFRTAARFRLCALARGFLFFRSAALSRFGFFNRAASRLFFVRKAPRFLDFARRSLSSSRLQPILLSHPLFLRSSPRGVLRRTPCCLSLSFAQSSRSFFFVRGVDGCALPA